MRYKIMREISVFCKFIDEEYRYPSVQHHGAGASAPLERSHLDAAQHQVVLDNRMRRAHLDVAQHQVVLDNRMRRATP